MDPTFSKFQLYYFTVVSFCIFKAQIMDNYKTNVDNYGELSHDKLEGQITFSALGHKFNFCFSDNLCDQ